jgi:hypothetical protein
MLKEAPLFPINLSSHLFWFHFITVPVPQHCYPEHLSQETIAVRGDGLGGRNQEMVLAFGLALEPLVAEGAIIKGQFLRFPMESNASD